MSDIICVTNRTLCQENFVERIHSIAKEKPKAIILREKDLTETEYLSLANKVLAICKENNTLCVIHSFLETASRLETDAIHFPMHLLCNLSNAEKSRFTHIGTSCHSLDDALEAEKLGCTYLVAGHIFATDCKKDLDPRGLAFLREICENVSIPVYAIGGIRPQTFPAILEAGAKGGCIMSGLMTCANVHEYMEALKNE